MVAYNGVEVSLKARWLLTMIGGGLTQGFVIAYNEVEVSLKAGWLLTTRWRSHFWLGIAYNEVEGGLTQGRVVAYNESGNG